MYKTEDVIGFLKLSYIMYYDNQSLYSIIYIRNPIQSYFVKYILLIKE